MGRGTEMAFLYRKLDPSNGVQEVSSKPSVDKEENIVNSKQISTEGLTFRYPCEKQHTVIMY